MSATHLHSLPPSWIKYFLASSQCVSLLCILTCVITITITTISQGNFLRLLLCRLRVFKHNLLMVKWIIYFFLKVVSRQTLPWLITLATHDTPGEKWNRKRKRKEGEEEEEGKGKGRGPIHVSQLQGLHIITKHSQITIPVPQNQIDAINSEPPCLSLQLLPRNCQTHCQIFIFPALRPRHP